jgi:hypothetical protein
MTTATKSPPTAATEAVRLLHRHDPALAGKLRGELTALEAETEALMARFAQKWYVVDTPLKGARFVQAIDATIFKANLHGPALVQLLERRAAIEEDLQGIGEKTPDRPPVEQEIFDLLTETDRAGEVRAWLSQQWARITTTDRQQLGFLDRDIDQAKAESDRHKLAECISDQAMRRERLKALKWDSGQRQRQATVAIEHLGGVDSLTGDVRAALAATERHTEATGAHAAALAAGTECEELDEQLCRVTDVAPNSRLARHLEQQYGAARDRWEAAKQAAHDEAESKLAALIDQAAQGDEPAIATIKALAASVPEAFPEGIASAFETMGLSDEQLTGVIAVLIQQE